MADSSEIDRDIANLWRAWRTAHEMIADRGYEVSDEEINLSLETFRSQYSNMDGTPDRRRMAFSARPTQSMIDRLGSEPGTIYVEFNGDSNVGIKQIRAFAQTIDAQHFTTGVFVSRVNVTPSALKIIPTVLPRIIEVFHEQDLLVNITKHELVPKHVLLSGEEKRALLERYRVKETQLPRIQVGDPVARYLGLRRGQVVKIIRKSETAGRYASYRWAI